MISVQQATEIINEVSFHAGKEHVGIESVLKRVLAEEIIADRDLPPFHRATMDGIAIKYQEGITEFTIEGIQAAGQPQQRLKSGCIEIMTGAMLPEGADTVVRYEDVVIRDGKAVVNAAIQKNQFIHSKGIDARESDILLKPGVVISPAEVALLASVGKSTVAVYQAKPIAIVTTGDELVPVDVAPLPWQIRRSNGVALASSLQITNHESQIFHLPDNPNILETQLSSIIELHDVIIISGGVSKGKFDYIPSVLEKLGIKKSFHQVKQRPGKPFWFGRSATKTVFALPGNPVSTFLCFHRYIKPWIEKGLGVETRDVKAILATDYTFKPDLTYFLQVKIDMSSGSLLAIPYAGEGSGDFANLRNVDGFIELPSERNEFKKGEAFPYIPFRQ
ncbi:MAG: molybdopterin molybdotransferase MoeA [Bacteroidota bacterium]